MRRMTLLAPAFAIAADVALFVPSGAAAMPPAPSIAALPTMVALHGSLHPRALPQFDAGRMDPGVRLSGMSLLFGMSAQQKALQRYAMAAVQDPASPSYHRWLTPEQYASEFGASSGDIARATAWLLSQGFSVDGPSRTATRLAFSGTIAQIEHAFQTEMHRYQVDGAAHFAMSRAPSVPADLTDVIVGLHGMHDFRAKASSQGAQPQYVLPITEPDGGPGVFPILAPADFAKIYDVDSLYAAGITGAGQSIAVAEQSDFNDADIAAFRTTFGLPDNPPTRVLVPNSGTAAVRGVASFQEAEIDIEWSGAVAPGATIFAVFTGNAPNVDESDALMYGIEQRTAPVLSSSFVRCEQWFTPADASFLEGYGATAALEGMTVAVIAGDTGAAGCDSQSALMAQYGQSVLFPAAVPSFVAVGGTQFQLTAGNQSAYLDGQLAALSYIPESAWNETLEDIDAGYGGLGAGGGGPSRLFAKPSWQVPYTANDGFRDVPDVALSASADILPYAVSMSWTTADGDEQAPQPQGLAGYGGTSAATPAFAGILALINQALAEANPSVPVGLGNANPMFYALANNVPSGNAFHDITSGNNIVPCAPGSPDCPSSPPYQFGYNAGPGYDLVTGVGSIDAANLVAAWKALTPTSTALQVTACGMTEGSPLQLTAMVSSKAAANAMTGSITFYFVSPEDGGVGLSGTLGVSQVTPSTSAGTERATASLAASAPGGPGGAGVAVGAFYSGDTHYLSSWSSFAPVGGTSTLAICPTAVTLATGQTGVTFTTTGGGAPIHFSIYNDTTCAKETDRIVCSSIDAGAFTAGPSAGTATIVAVDDDSAYVTAAVSVISVSADSSVPMLPATSCGSDGGPPALAISPCEPDGGVDSGEAETSVSGSVLDATPDTQEQGAAEAREPANPPGCGCSAAGGDRSAVAYGWAAGALLAFAIARRAFNPLRRHPRGPRPRSQRR